ncbi:MAG TPA: PASTA domain-containing protein [Fimbriimonas sp.]
MIGSVLRVRYELTGALADGPLYTTYSARDRTLGREVCIRIVKPPFSREPVFIEVLRRSVKRVSAIHHPNIETMADVEDHEGSVFIVSELTRGPSLADRIRKLAPFSIPVSVGMVISVLQALDAFHKSGIVHGDLYPGHISVLGDGQARLQMGGLSDAYATSPTAASLILPSLAPYLAPEVSSGGPSSISSDIYAVGIILYELLSGRQPYYADTALATAMKHGSQPTPNVRSINPSVPEVLDEIVKMAMDKDPARRYASAAEMLVDLRLVQDALRFGKSLSWPLRGEGKASPKPQEPKPVTPRMSAVRTEREAEDLPKRARRERDVPVWMLVMITALGAIVLSLVGVWVIFNMKSPKLLDVPKLKGLSVQEATEVLEDSNLQLRVSQRISSESVPMDRIIETSPEQGQKVREGGFIHATVSSGSRSVLMPDVRNMTLDKARSILSGLDLEIELPIQNVASGTVPEGQIARQIPAPRQRIERTSRVRLYVSSGGAGGSGQQPSDSNVIYQYTVRMVVSDVPEPVMVRIDIVDPESPEGRTIYNSQHSAGEEIEQETQSSAPEVKFVIYYDDEEVTTIEERATAAQRR